MRSPSTLLQPMDLALQLVKANESPEDSSNLFQLVRKWATG